MKRALKIIWGIVLAIAALLFASWMLIQTPRVQTFMAKKAIASLGERFNGRIEFSKIHFKPFNALVLKDIVILDDDPPVTAEGEVLDTVVRAGSIVTTFSLKGLVKREGVHLRRVNVSDASLTLVNEARGGNLQRFLNSAPKDSASGKAMGHIFDAQKVLVENFRFRLIDLDKESPPMDYGIDWTDLDITVRSLDAHDLSLAHGYMKGIVDNLTAYEKSGYRITSLSGKTRVGNGRTLVQDFRLTDRWSDIWIPEYSMTYGSIKSFSDYIHEVRMTGDIRSSKVDFKSISYFVPGLRGNGICLNLSRADVDGTVSDLGINRFEFSEIGSGVSGSVEGRISGLPEASQALLDFTLENLGFTSEGLGKFISGFAPEAKVDLGRYAPGEKVLLDGRVNGTLGDLDVKGIMGSEALGLLDADIRIRNLIGKGTEKRFNGSLSTRRLDLGKFLGIKQVGGITMRSALDASIEDGRASLRIDTLFIDRLGAMGYEYSNIVAAGTFSDKAFDGRVVCNDPNLNFLFQGIFTLSDKTSNGLYKFYANVGYADLNAIGLDKRGISKVSGMVNANYMTVSSGDIIGDLDILDLNLENSHGRHDIGDIRINSHSNNDLHRINLASSFADGTYVGTKPITSMVGDLKELTLQRELPVLCKELVQSWKGDSYDVRLDVHDARDVLSFAMPGLYIADSTKARLDVSESGEVKATVKSPRLAMGKDYLRNLNLTFDNKDGSLNGVVNSSELSVAGLLLKNDNITIYASSDHVGAGFSYDNQAELTDKGEIYLSGEFGRGPGGELLVHGKTLPSSIWYNDEGWTITPTNIEVAGKSIKVDNLVAACEGQSLRIDGGFSPIARDTLRVDLVRLDMGLANRFVGDGFGISGHASGHARLISPIKGNAGLMLSIVCDSARVAGRDVGTLRLASSLDEDGKMHFIAKNEMGGSTTLNINGDYFTKDKTLDMFADLDGMDVGYLAPVLSSVFSEMGGRMGGKVRVAGKTGNLSLSSEGTRFDNVLLRVAFTNVPYYVSGPFSIGNNGLIFDDIALRDRYDGTGKISGGLLFNRLKDIRMDTRIRMDRMEVIDMEESAGEAFYGNVFASGNVSIRGPLNAIQLDVVARTDKNGAIHIPVDKASEDVNSNLLTFKEELKEVYVDPYEMMMNRLVTESRKGDDFGLKLKISANPGTEAYIEIDRSAGNVLNGRGQGNIEIEVRPMRNLFTINGDYTLNSGNFHFNAMDIAKRNFTLSRGSSIRFNGDVMDSDLDIEGTYSTKASIATLIADTSSVSTRRTVNCGIGISGKLREPQLTFSIDVPDLDPTTKSKVESALNTEDKVQRQFLALLISGGFMPEEQSGVVNNSGMLYTNVAEIMAGQLNNILQKLDIPLDFGLNYQSSESGTNIFDVAVSTQLFNSRVIVNGNVGNREYGNSSEGDVVGDLDIEIKLDKPGQIRLNLFSHSADDYTSYLDNTQRNGIGITYQREFNTFREFVRNLFTGRKKREQRMRAAAAASPAEREMNRLVITEEEL